MKTHDSNFYKSTSARRIPSIKPLTCSHDDYEFPSAEAPRRHIQELPMPPGGKQNIRASAQYQYAQPKKHPTTAKSSYLTEWCAQIFKHT